MSDAKRLKKDDGEPAAQEDPVAVGEEEEVKALEAMTVVFNAVADMQEELEKVGLRMLASCDQC
jgi:hypothetical protein